MTYSNPHLLHSAARLSVAPMMDWTDRHCRYLHRLLSKRALLYTEMVTSPALVRGDARHLLRFDPSEQPVALQLGGSDPVELAKAAVMGAEEGYPEINLNCGCPSDRVQSGAFGAVLMTQPALVADCCRAMIAAQPAEVTVKCRIGVDDQDPAEVLPEFLAQIVAAGVERVTIHARKAWLQGLSPKENRDIPPLDHDLVFEMKQLFPHLHISINGGIASLEHAKTLLDGGLDGVMIGRAAYHNPTDILRAADAEIWGEALGPDPVDVVLQMRDYIEAHVADQSKGGGKLAHVTRHMLGLFAGQPGSRQWRRHLSEHAYRAGAGWSVVEDALAAMEQAAA
ncbi:tRNA dihydrouridine(20/20a) synthase DusA [Octadecabacter sp. 1_MG-2023]|uniref:tRNA dihydrouridine(20/20a) synthase DusA n=1 Tax=unclassified Octadecabacter TaxID=196158 RepID=UPI001C088B38|nr:MULTISPECIES: tRNA dihydrouridine(20/20a) synthase DusA [unclassified Octadecabacter]MBU2993083.1 tRNA dihydrouridine(20/20a) synthase DusA [Octadecabacter sp. B2R22]MDO6733465.1 tRNA dihydrouridine(20/20a) synthase DusA [Octadecabacter sp. 1_MG-2023]